MVQKSLQKMDSAGLFIYTLLYCQFICTNEIFYLFLSPCTAAIKCAVISLKWFKVSMSNSRICLSMIKVLYQIYHRLIRNHNHKMHKGEAHYQETKNFYPISHQRQPVALYLLSQLFPLALSPCASAHQNNADLFQSIIDFNRHFNFLQ